MLRAPSISQRILQMEGSSREPSNASAQGMDESGQGSLRRVTSALRQSQGRREASSARCGYLHANGDTDHERATVALENRQEIQGDNTFETQSACARKRAESGIRSQHTQREMGDRHHLRYAQLTSCCNGTSYLSMLGMHVYFFYRHALLLL